MAEPVHSSPRSGGMPPRAAAVWAVLRASLGAAARPELAVLDAGGGSGELAVPLAELGHHVTVVDPSPDSLAALSRRAEEAGVSGRVQGLQGDAAELGRLVPPAGFDLVLCHRVLEVVDDPAAAMGGLAAALRPGGLVSIVVANRSAAVVHRVLSGRLREAHQLLAGADGHAGPGDPLLRRFDVGGVEALVAGAGLQVQAVHGVRVFSDFAPAAVLDGDPADRATLAELEELGAALPAYLAVAAQLHVLAVASGAAP